jgi:hypothetical protein
MKKTVISLLCILMLLCMAAIPAFAATNMVQSGDFEGLDPENPIPFYFWSAGGLTFPSDNVKLDAGRNSDSSFYMNTTAMADDNLVYQFIEMDQAFDKTKTYTLSAWVKAEVVQSWDKPTGGIYLLAQYKNGGITAPVVDAAFGLTGRITATTNGWVNLKFDFVPTTKTADLLVVGLISHVNGKIWVDDMSLATKGTVLTSTSVSSTVKSSAASSSAATPTSAPTSVTSSIVSSTAEATPTIASSSSASVSSSSSDEKVEGNGFNILYVIIPAGIFLVVCCGAAYFLILKKK